MQTDFLQFMYKAINDLLTQNLGFFDAMGQNLFRMFATILIVWYGVKSALSAASGKHSLHFDNFASLLLTIAFGFAMVNYYSTPIPGIGSSFHNLITDEAQFLANRINQAELQTIVDRISDFEARIDSPGVTDILGTIIYAVVIILLAAAQAIAIVVIAYGFIATAVCVLVGPVFVPFFIVPKLEWLFWGWLRCFVQYAFYEVVARRGRLHHRESHYRRAHAPARRHRLDASTDRVVSCSLDHVSFFDLCAGEGSGADKSHLQRHSGRLLRRVVRGNG